MAFRPLNPPISVKTITNGAVKEFVEMWLMQIAGGLPAYERFAKNSIVIMTVEHFSCEGG